MERKPNRPINKVSSWSNNLCIWRGLWSIVHFLGPLDMLLTSRLWASEATLHSLLQCLLSWRVALLHLADLVLECVVSRMSTSREGIPWKFCPASSHPRVDCSMPGPLNLVIWTAAPPWKHSLCPLSFTIDNLGLTPVQVLHSHLQASFYIANISEITLLVRISHVRLYSDNKLTPRSQSWTQKRFISCICYMSMASRG